MKINWSKIVADLKRKKLSIPTFGFVAGWIFFCMVLSPPYTDIEVFATIIFLFIAILLAWIEVS